MLLRSQWLFLISCFTFGSTQKNIGAICDDGGFILEAVFTVAVEAVSSEDDPYEAKIVRTTHGDVLEAHNAMCSVLEENVFGVFGPSNEKSLKHVQSIADFLEVPQILIEQSIAQSPNWSAINLYPNHLAYSQFTHYGAHNPPYCFYSDGYIAYVTRDDVRILTIPYTSKSVKALSSSGGIKNFTYIYMNPENITLLSLAVV